MTGTTTPEPAASVDPSSNPVYVPGYGWVSWPRALLDAQARYLTFIHRPNHPPLSRRMRRWLRVRGNAGASDGTDESLCVFCGLEWLCPEAAWARGWLSPMARLRGRCRPRHRARARARGLLRRLRGSSAGPGRRPDRSNRSARSARPDRSGRPDRLDHSDRSSPLGRLDGSGGPEQAVAGRPVDAAPAVSARSGGSDRTGRSGGPDRPAGTDGSDRADRPDRPSRRRGPGSAAPAGCQGSRPASQPALEPDHGSPIVS